MQDWWEVGRSREDTSHRKMFGPAMVDHRLAVGLEFTVHAAKYVSDGAMCENGKKF